MADRKSAPITKEWVDALNTIDFVFQENKKVRHAWRETAISESKSSLKELLLSKWGDFSFKLSKYSPSVKLLIFYP